MILIWNQLRRIPPLLRGETGSVSRWIETRDRQLVASWLAVLIVGSALYGAAMGSWRAPEQALYTAIKFPLVILLTTLGNALLNSMLAPLLGVNMGFRQSLAAVFMSFTIAAAILGAFSPLLAFVVWNTPPFHLELRASFLAYQFMQLAVVAGIAFAGIMANVRLLPLLEARAVSRRAAMRVLLAWLVVNLFLGSQVSWVLRPFISLPHVPPMFLLPEPFQGSFFEEVFEAIRALVTGESNLQS